MMNQDPSIAENKSSGNYQTEWTQLEQKILDLRVSELDTRKGIIDLLSEANKNKIWKLSGYKTLGEYCQRGLDYDVNETREILIRMGLILLSSQLISDSPIVQNRIDILKKWRRKKANDQQIAAFRIFSNKTLLAIAESYPNSVNDLLKVNGIGPRKMQQFGEELIQILHSVH